MATELLGKSAGEGARLVALGHLEDSRLALARLGTSEDDEALHDFRVALRRLRSWLRAYRPWLAGSISAKRRRQLANLAAATGAGRDTEVQLDWLTRVAARAVHPRQRPGLTWLVARLQARRGQAYDQLRSEITERYQRFHDRLVEELSVYPARLGEEPPGFASVTAELVHGHAADVARALAAVTGPADEAAAHEARIRGKRLRYLLEPLRGEVPGVDAVLARLKRLQELLGDLHDTAVLTAEIRPALEEVAADRARRAYQLVLGDEPTGGNGGDAHAGLLAVARLCRRRRDARFAELSAEWLVGAGGDFFAAVAGLAASLTLPAVEERAA